MRYVSRVMLSAAAVAFLAWQVNVGVSAFQNIEAALAFDQQMLTQVEAVRHDDRTLLVCHPTLGLVYVLRHYPVKWSFVPANDRTLQLLASRYRIGTIIQDADSTEIVQGASLDALLKH